MKYQNFLYAALSGIVILFQSFGMTKFQSFGMKKTEMSNEMNLINIIKIQQNLLGKDIPLYIPIHQVVHNPDFFKTRFTIINTLDPKNHIELLERKVREEKVEAEAIKCINLIIYQYPIIPEQLRLITERFHNKTLHFLESFLLLLSQMLFQEIFLYEC